jgi:hypothetical protein
MSDLLNKASLVVIPSGYKEDTVYSVVPSDGSGDLSFTRASNGTRVNSAGLVEVCPWNLADNSENFSAVYIPIYATLSNNTTSAPNGTTTADSLLETTDTEVHAITTDYTQPSGAQYTYSVYVKTISGRNVRVSGSSGFSGPIALVDLSNGSLLSGSTGASVASVGGGWYRISLTATSTTTQVRILIYSMNGTATTFAGSTSNGVYLWGAQLNIGSTAKPYFPTTDRLNVPRLTYQNGGGGCPSLLLEKQSTNYAQYSEDFSNGFWTKDTTTTITANDAISPDGTQNADRFESPSSSKGIYSYGVSGSQTISVYIKAGNSGNVGKSATLFTTLATQDFILTNDWQRISVSGAASSLWALYPSATNSFTNVLIWGGQAENSSYPTSYIPTTSASATRVADACSKTGISSLIGQTEGVLFLDFIFTNINDTQVIMSLHDNANNKRVEIWANASSLYGFVGGSSSFNIASLTATNSARYKVAVAYKSGDSAYYVNGTQIGTNSTTFTISLTSLIFDYWGGGYPPNAKVNEAIIFPTRLTNAELASLTTL